MVATAPSRRSRAEYVLCHGCDRYVLTESVALVGREFELARVDAFLAELPSRAPRALLIEGEPGVGKTALWLQGLSSARAQGFRALVARPVEVETALSFAALVDLLEPVLEEVLPRLPEPQRRALEIALLLRPADAAPDRRALATAVLNALRVVSEACPLIVAVDDVQWLDSSSHAVLAFAARRLAVKRVGFMLTHRTDGAGITLELEAALGERLERLTPAPLSMGALNRLLQMHFGRTFSRPLVRRLREVSGGNPFFTLELAQALEQQGATRDSIRELPLPATLREVVHDRLASLPVAERRLLVAVAALAHPSLDLLGAAFGRTIDASALKRSFAAHVVELEAERIQFAHPLLGSVVYADASSESRRRVHRRLAEAVSDPEESAQHLALATERPDAPGERPLLLAGAVVASATAALTALHPGRRQLATLPRRPSLPLLALAAAACLPGSQYALHMAFNQRDGVLPADAHLGLGHWAALSAAALATLLAALVAALRTSGFTIPAYTAAAAALAWALTCLVYPNSAGSLSPTWAELAIAWAIAFAATTWFVARRPASRRRPGARRVGQGRARDNAPIQERSIWQEEGSC
jgi:AAA ATPase domain